jgi:hypothetical protein
MTTSQPSERRDVFAVCAGARPPVDPELLARTLNAAAVAAGGELALSGRMRPMLVLALPAGREASMLNAWFSPSSARAYAWRTWCPTAASSSVPPELKRVCLYSRSPRTRTPTRRTDSANSRPTRCRCVSQRLSRSSSSARTATESRLAGLTSAGRRTANGAPGPLPSSPASVSKASCLAVCRLASVSRKRTARPIKTGALGLGRGLGFLKACPLVDSSPPDAIAGPQRFPQLSLEAVSARARLTSGGRHSAAESEGDGLSGRRE